ncbi:hypothetical protein GQ55_2G444500 [Panicum hallii var. hallii]|uniref:Uncharacterized protein n=1 Tax=Panicum hallii var. hallii TaxID=1504633 RepID=A0A2T7EZ07_9POAL|nr:hypothetical protein GQ55_2G444500 [Panicum hallii var. hallii]
MACSEQGVTGVPFIRKGEIRQSRCCRVRHVRRRPCTPPRISCHKIVTYICRWRGGGGKPTSIRGDGRAVSFPAVMARRRGGGAAVCERNRVEVVGSGWILAVE